MFGVRHGIRTSVQCGDDDGECNDDADELVCWHVPVHLVRMWIGVRTMSPVH